MAKDYSYLSSSDNTFIDSLYENYKKDPLVPLMNLGKSSSKASSTLQGQVLVMLMVVERSVTLACEKSLMSFA